MPGIADDITTALKGAAMGAANVIPGVSGGTIAFVTGIYERLINAIKSCGPHALKLLLGRRFKEFADHIDLRFLAAIAIGAGVSIVVLARFLELAFKDFPIPTWAFFFGLIVASIWGVGKMVKHWGPATFIAMAIGLGLAIGVLFLPHASGNTSPVYLVVCGMIAISSMIIPGVSGSFMLLVMGNYALVLGAIGDRDLGILAPFAVGCVVGLIALSHVLSWIFKNHHDVAVALITGFIVGSLALIWPWKDTVHKVDEAGLYEVKLESREIVSRQGDFATVDAGLVGEEEMVEAGYENWKLPPFGERETWIAILLAAFGAGIVVVIERVGGRSKEEEAAAG
jgi:putative membrane protein